MNTSVKLWRNQKYLHKNRQLRGKVVSWTIIRVPPSGFEAQAPYPVALVNLGKKFMVGQLVDISLDEINVGLKVVSVIRRIKQPDSDAVIPYGIKFRPL